jgi:hypothetical protein
MPDAPPMVRLDDSTAAANIPESYATGHPALRPSTAAGDIPERCATGISRTAALLLTRRPDMLKRDCQVVAATPASN